MKSYWKSYAEGYEPITPKGRKLVKLLDKIKKQMLEALMYDAEKKIKP